jgi:hypothetical protein
MPLSAFPLPDSSRIGSALLDVLSIKVVDIYQASCSGNAGNCVRVVYGSIIAPSPWPSLTYSGNYTDNMNKYTIIASAAVLTNSSPTLNILVTRNFTLTL